MSNVIKNFGLDTQLISSVVGKFKPGSRIRLISKNNTYVPSLAEGTVDFVDDIGQIFVEWDNGIKSSLNPLKDNFILIKEEK